MFSVFDYRKVLPIIFKFQRLWSVPGLYDGWVQPLGEPRERSLAERRGVSGCRLFGWMVQRSRDAKSSKIQQRVRVAMNIAWVRTELRRLEARGRKAAPLKGGDQWLP
jgi:hypothetical protein